MLSVRNLSKNFDGIPAVKNLSLELKKGEIFVLLGPNGAGKTTTLKLIAGLLHPDTGEILLDGIDLKKEPVKYKSLIGYVPDEPFIYNKLTGREFINFVAGLFGIKKQEYDKRLTELIKKFEIGNWIDEPAETYSHGMKQKIVMCQLLIHEPELILIDEPLVGLDPKMSKIVRETFIELAQKGKTLLVSTHTLSFARQIAQRLGIINKGELKFVGTPEELARIAGREDIEEIYLKLTEEN
ncbi:MAG: ABC transporter ATP-binding protein [candidate division WOR-3 bacterium]|nr:ABC transporter ATP-binding protein [candidate division WOR-3 bacterium]